MSSQILVKQESIADCCWTGTPKVEIKVKVKVTLTAKILPNDFEDFSGNGRKI